MSDWRGFDQQTARKRGAIARHAMFFTAIAAVFGAGFGVALFKIVTGDGGFIVMFVISLVFGLPFAYRARDYLRDLAAEPGYVEGEVTRKWSKANFLFFFMHGYYMVVQEGMTREQFIGGDMRPRGEIYSVEGHDYVGLLEGDRVRIFRYPHSLTIEYIERYDLGEKKFVPVKLGAS